MRNAQHVLVNTGRKVLAAATLAGGAKYTLTPSENAINREYSNETRTIVAPIEASLPSKESQGQSSQNSLELSYVSTGYEKESAESVENEDDFKSVQSPAVLDMKEVGEHEETFSVNSDLTGSIVEESAVLPDIGDVLGYSAVQELQRQPMTESELTGAIETIRSGENVLSRIIPSPLRPFDSEQISKLFGEVADILNQKGLIETARAKIEGTTTSSQSFDDQPPVKFSYSDAEEVSAWSALVKKAACPHCKDVLCAPTLMPCNHSICAVCVEALENQVTGPEVSPCCAKCHEPIHKINGYQRKFDEVILAEVESLPECESKRKWKQRRAKGLHLLDTRHLLNPARKNEGSSSDSYSSWFNSYWASAVLGMVVLVVMVVLKVRVR